MLLAAYGASRFHFAEPELNGLGVTTSTPGLSRSSQSLMPLGLPLRTTMVTTEPNGMPLVASAFQSSVDQAGVDQAGDVGLDGEVDDVGRGAGRRPCATGRPRRRRTAGTATPLPASVALNAGMSLSKPGLGTAYAKRLIVLALALPLPAAAGSCRGSDVARAATGTGRHHQRRRRPRHGGEGVAALVRFMGAPLAFLSQEESSPRSPMCK